MIEPPLNERTHLVSRDEVQARAHLDFDDGLARHLEVARATRDALRDAFAAMVAVWVEALRTGGKLLLFGNGGSASDAQHLAAELVVRLREERPAIAAVALTTDASILTAAANDLGFERVFERQVRALGSPGDVAVGLSTSGRSPNVIHALRTARQMGLRATALGGGDGGDLVGVADPLLLVPCDDTQSIQEMHITLGHLLCASGERELSGEG